VSARDGLARIFGPDLLELLASFVREEVEAAFRQRETDRRWLTTEAAAERYGVSASSLRKRAARGTLSHSRMGRRLLIDTRTLDRELERGRR
jgi:excisionase family DNA binding protein